MNRTRVGILLVVSVLSGVGATPRLARAQDLPPELTGDYSELPPPPPPPRRRPPPPPVDDESANPEFGDIGPLPPEAEPTTPDASEAEPTAEPEVSAADAGATEASDETAEVDSAAPQSTRFYAGLGFGVGTLSFTRPADGGVQKLGTTPFAAVDVDVRAHLGHANTLSFEGVASYRTSIGLVLETDPLFALPENVNVRTQRLELSLAPRLRVSDSVAIALPIGFAIHLFTPEAHQYPLDPYSLGGVMLRPELIIALGTRVNLRVGPELQWLLLFNRSLTREGVCCSGGALGGQATLQTSLSSVFSLALNYRELRSLVPVAARFTDIERVVTARLVGEL